MTTVSLGVFNVTVPYLHKPKTRRTWHYRRAVPSALRQHYDQKEIIKSLATIDEHEAAQRCLAINKQTEEEFDRLKRGLPKTIAQPTYDLALEKLNTFGLYQNLMRDQDAPANFADDFLDHLADKLKALLPKQEFEQIWYRGKPIPEGLMDAVDKAALELMQGKYRPCASSYVTSYVQLKGRLGDKKFIDSLNGAIGYLLEFLPDKPPGEYTRPEVRKLISSHMAKGKVKTATLHRQLTMLRAMFNKVAKEHELKEDILHPFTEFDIPGLRDDALERKDFTATELNTLRQKMAGRKHQLTSLIHLMLETGLRVKECCGLQVTDISLDVDVPYVVVQKNPFRRLKTESSRRYIPLVGVALAAMERQIAESNAGGWVFPDYVDEEKKTIKNTSASAAANKRIRSSLGENAPTCHSFRHTFSSRLRNVECPKDIRDELGGWASGISNRYGSPADIKIKQAYLIKSIDAPSGVDWAKS